MAVCLFLLVVISKSIIYTPPRKYPYGKQKLDDFCQISLESKLLQKIYIYHWKALISSIQNLYRKGVWPLQQSSYAHFIEYEPVLLKGAWQICGKGHALC